MEPVFKACAIGIVSAILGLVVKKSNPENALLISIASAAAILAPTITILSSIYDYLKTTAETAGISDSVLTVVIKCAGISVVTRMSAGAMRDCGQSGTAEAAEMLGTASAILLSLPLLRSVFSVMERLMS